VYPADTMEHPSSLKPRLAAFVLVVSLTTAPANPPNPDETVGHKDGQRSVTPVNQTLTPLGKQVELTGLRPQALALSPDGRRLLVTGKTGEVLVVDPASGQILQRAPLPSEDIREPRPEVASVHILKPDTKGQVSFTGLVYAPDGKRVFLSNVNGSIKVFEVDGDGALRGSHSLLLPPADAPRRKQEIPAGLAFRRDGKRLYVCANLSNQLLELDPDSGAVLRRFEVGVAPYEVKVIGAKAYVSNWGGRRVGPGDLSADAGRGTRVRVDGVRFVASEGSVSVVDLNGSGAEAGGGGAAIPAAREILTGIHASGLAVSPNGRYLVCANAGADHLSVVDTRSDTVVETVWTKPSPADLLGASPNALAFAPDGRTLYAANGTQNAVAVVRFEPGDRESQLVGLLPVGWFPGALAYDAARKQLIVANIKGLPSQQKKGPVGAEGFNSHHYNGTLSLVPLPAAKELPALSEAVTRNLRKDAIVASQQPARTGVVPVPVPERIGEPSVFKHVIYVIKENRTYDQVLGDDPRGNGRADLCIFGKDITPNLHKIAREFVLLDNTYCCGILSADGHQWSTTAFATDYMEKSFAGFPRSYPDGMDINGYDALAYSPAGFLWDNILKHGKTLRNFGEFAAPAVKWKDPSKKGSPTFTACYKIWKGESEEVVFGSFTEVESLKPYTPTDYVGWNMSVPDQYRADYFLKELKQLEAHGDLPHLTIVCLPNDHTSGTSPGQPTPAACMADNDLAFGRIVEAVSRSRFWPETLILAIEDDPQAGWDHVSGYRTTAFCISPYTRRGAVVSTQYNTTSLLRTIEQVLGVKPMNQFDASASPMRECFTDTPDFTPYKALPSNIPLDQMNPPAKAQLNPVLRRDAIASAKMNFREVDRAPEDALNRILWNATAGPNRPFPAWAVAAHADEDDKPKAARRWFGWR
jgi:DNA-binding beta-propeller fold protein YncE